MLRWIHGPKASAARDPLGSQWIILPRQERVTTETDTAAQNNSEPDHSRQEPRQLPLGIKLQIDHLRTREGRPGPLSGARVDPWAHQLVPLAALVIGIVVALSLLALTWGRANFGPLPELGRNIALLALGFWLSAQTLVLLEWSLLRGQLQGDAPLLRWRGVGLRIERCAWELGRFWSRAAGLVLLNGLLLAACWQALRSGSLLGTGAFLGAWYSLAAMLDPVAPGPGQILVRRVLGTVGFLQVQDILLLGLILKPSATLKGRLTVRTSATAIIMVAWLLGTAASFGWIADRLDGFDSLNLLAAKGIVYATGLLFCLGMMLQVLQFFRRNTLLRSAAESEPIAPSADELQQWRTECALLVHLPELSELPWRWNWMPAGTLLVQKGERDRDFHWLVSGEAKVLGVDTQLENIQLATLHSPCGFGEIAFLKGGERTADILIKRDAVLASVDAAEFQAIRTPELERKLTSLVLGAQAMDKSQMFQGLPSALKEAWLRAARLVEAPQGTCIIEQGEQEQWMGLLVQGELEVLRSGTQVATLRANEVFGEMARWTGTPRQAKLMANQGVIYLRWEPDWWFTQAKEAGLQQYMEELVAQRMPIAPSV